MHLNQYYTEKAYGDKLIQNLTLSSPRLALDIGFGSGNLLRAAKRRWNDIDLIGIDIDSLNVQKEESISEIHALELNGFDPSLPEIITNRFGIIDLLLSNPPYFARQFDQTAKSILQSVGLLSCISASLKKIPAELIFLAQNLRLLSENGELGIILPAGLISGERWRKVREYLFTNYQVTNIIQLPVNSFKKTDAQTFILTIKNSRNVELKQIRLTHTNKEEIIFVDLDHAIHRADFDYYANRGSISSTKSLNKEDYFLFRGNKSSDYLESNISNYLHTTKMSKKSIMVDLPNQPIEGCKNTRPGDIILARVGRRCLGRVEYINKGSLPISDCIICIRPTNQSKGHEIFKALSTINFRTYLQNVSLGVGAKYITHQTVNDFLTGEYNEAS